MGRANVNPNRRFTLLHGLKTRGFLDETACFLALRGGKSAVREFDHGLAGRDLFVVLVADQDIDQDPARFVRGLLRLDDSRRLDGVAGFYRLDPAGFEAAMDGAGGGGPGGGYGGG